jgi:hypothetical protein
MRENEPQTLSNEYPQAIKMLNAHSKSAILNNFIMSYEDLHVEEQQLNPASYYLFLHVYGALTLNLRL